MTHRHKLTRWLRSLGKAEADTEAETAGTETARYPRVQKIQQSAILGNRVMFYVAAPGSLSSTKWRGG
jgi:rubrerythrin